MLLILQKLFPHLLELRDGGVEAGVVEEIFVSHRNAP